MCTCNPRTHPSNVHACLQRRIERHSYRRGDALEDLKTAQKGGPAALARGLRADGQHCTSMLQVGEQDSGGRLGCWAAGHGAAETCGRHTELLTARASVQAGVQMLRVLCSLVSAPKVSAQSEP